VPEETKKNHTDRDVELVLRKKELKEEFWPRLLKEKGKVHFLRTDFDKVRLIKALLRTVCTNFKTVG
jgi:hypothetical protein